MQKPWIVVLAGGEGTRLQTLTRALYGVDLPKQFAVLVGERSLLQLTVERAAQLTTRDRSGALWNTFIQCGTVATYWELARRHLPIHADALERYAAAIGTLGEQHALDEAYARMEPANFSRDLLAHATELAVVPVTGTGWSDWGSPRRVFESLAGSAHLDALLARIRGSRIVLAS